MIRNLIIYIALVVISFASLAQSQDLMGFDRGSFGSVVLSQTQSAGTDIQLELSIGNYENEPIINYSVGSVFAQIGRSVGRLDVLTDKGMFPCTAFIVSKKYILTNYHCSLGLLDNERIGATRIDAVQFVAGYTQTGIDEGTKKYTVIPTPVETSKPLDYAVLEVIGDPSQEYGQLKLSSILPNGGDPFWIIGHPMGEGQRISREKCKANKPALSTGKLLHTCDTLPGNSGSPVIDAGLQQVVALHHAGSRKDSVNFAILMSEILENSKVLTAYKAPSALPVVNAEPTKTVEVTACDALYSAAAEAKACFAYEAYVKSCRDHSLAPIADGYIQEFCQVAEVDEVEENIDPLADTVPVEPLCHNNSNSCSDMEVAAFNFVEKAFELSSGIGSNKLMSVLAMYAKNVEYYGNSWSKKQIREDKISFFKRWPVRDYQLDLRRSNVSCLTDQPPSQCAVSGLIVWKTASPERNKEADGEARFDYSLTYTDANFPYGQFYIVKENSYVITRKSLPDCPSDQSKRFDNCFGTYTDADGAKYVGEFKDNGYNGQATYTYGPNSEWAGDKYVGQFKGNNRNGQGTYTFSDGGKYVGEWKDGKRDGLGFYFSTDYQVDFCTYKKGQGSNCSGSNAYDAAVILKKRFDGLSLYQRKKIQSNLNTRGFYNNSIDGQWGLGTLIALVEFSSVEFGTVDLRSEKMAKKIIAFLW